MREKIRDRLSHGGLTLLMATGLAMPVLGMLDPALVCPSAFVWLAVTVLVFEVLALHKAAALSGAAAVLVGAGIWLTAGKGMQTVTDAMLAMSLRMRGIRTAVPLAADGVIFLVAVGLALLSCIVCLKKATCIPALLCCIGVALAVWLTDSMQFLPWLLPALAAALTMVLVSRFEETPVWRVLPWAAGIVAVAFLISGGNGAAIPPLKEKTDEIRQAILDRMFFTEARDVFSLYAEGYMPQGADQLGGKPNPGTQPVMQVSTPKTAYLRGTVFNHYNGHAWENTLGGRRFLWQNRRTAEEREALFDEALPAPNLQSSLNTTYTVSVRMLSGSASTLFVPQRVRELNPGGELVPYFTNSSEVFVTRNLQGGDTYAVSAPLYTSEDPGIGELLSICENYADPQEEKYRNIYTELPGHLEQPVYDLALEVTAHAETPYAKALAIRNWLSRNFRYTTDVGEHPENIDFVTSFLLDTKKGYCTYFASAMTVLCRMAGLPARYVEGFLAEPNGQGEALVTGENAHAWTEVYFKGFGWLTFDATPRTRRGTDNGNGGGSGGTPPENPTPTPDMEAPTPEAGTPEETEPAGETATPEGNPDKPEEETPTPGPDDGEPDETPTPDEPEDTPAPDEGESPPPVESPSDEPTETPAPDNGESPPADGPDIPEPPAGNSSGGFPWVWLLLLLLPAALVLRIVMTDPALREKRADSEEKRFDIWTEEITRLLAAEGMTRNAGESPMAFARRIDRTAVWSLNLSPAGECLSLIRYSKASPMDTDTALMRDTATVLRGEISKPARLRYWLRRIFAPAQRKNRKTLSKS